MQSRSPYYNTQEIILEEILDRGSFGIVYKGKLADGNGEIALKLLKKRNGEPIREFSDEHKKEIGVLLKVKHKYIVEFLGVVRKSIAYYHNEEPFLCDFLIFEYMSNGNARNFVRNTETPQGILFDISYGIACGMAYLHENDIIHRDLAARNILIDAKYQAKISDFGLSRIIDENYDYYPIRDTTTIPNYRWIPRECLQTGGKFSKSSDVWSFGVTLWEIWNKGEVPYGNLNNEEVRNGVSGGQNPMSFEIPEGIPQKIKKLLEDIFVQDDLRPSFGNIKIFLNDIKGNGNLNMTKFSNQNNTIIEIDGQNSGYIQETFYSANSISSTYEMGIIISWKFINSNSNSNKQNSLEEISERLVEANNIYKMALESGVEDGQILLKKALSIYNSQINQVPKKLLHSLFYNMGMAHFRIVEIVQNSNDCVAELTSVGHHLKEAVKFFGKALLIHRNIDSDWALKVLQKIENMIELGLERADLYVDKEPPSELYSYVDVVLIVSKLDDYVGNFIRSKCSLTQSRYFYKRSCDKLNSGDFEGSLQYLEYSRERIQLALQNAKHLESEEIRMMEEQWKTQECMAKSVQLKTQADKLLEGMQNQTRNKEYKLFTIVDMYKDAILFIRKIDMKKECILLARIGNLFQNDLKMSWKAKQYYEEALQLGQNFTQKELNSFQWYMKAKEFLESKRTKNEPDIGPIKQKFKRQLKKIKTISDKCKPTSSIECKIKTTQEMLIHVYSHHPPRSSFEFKRDELTDENTQKFLRKAIIYYHPSRGGRDNSDQEWNVLSEEIVKYLTPLYEYFK